MTFVRHLATAAVALLVVFALTATGAQAAAFHVESAKAQITGEYPSEGKKSPTEAEAITFRFKTNVPCLKASFTGSMPTTTTEALTLMGGPNTCIAVKFTMGACHLLVKSAGTLNIEGGVECEAKPIEIEPQFGCRVTVPPQSGLSTVSFANSGAGSKRDVTATLSVKKLHYVQLTTLCSGGMGTFTNGELTGMITLRADLSEGGQQGLWFE